MPARVSFWRSPCLRRRRVSILKAKASTPPTLATSLVWQLPCLYREPWCKVARQVSLSRPPSRSLWGSRQALEKSSAKAVKWSARRRIFLARCPPLHEPRAFGWFFWTISEMTSNWISSILPVTLQNVVLYRSPFVQKEAGHSWSFACTPIARDQSITTNSCRRLGSGASGRPKLALSCDNYPHRFCSFYR
jgi:hypothetical protein